MSSVLHIISNYALAIYVTCTAGVLFYLRFLVQAQREERQSIFALEKETAATEARRSLIIVFVFLAIMTATGLLDLFVLPQQNHLIPTPTPSPFEAIPLTPTPTATATAAPTATPRPTQRPRPTTTPVPPTQPPQPVANCPNPGVTITSPRMNAPIQGIVPIQGTASIARFSFYKVEYGAGSKPTVWHSLSSTHANAVVNGTLDVWNTAGFPAGVYTVRLTVVDQTSNFPAPCTVQVVIQ